MRYTKPAAFIIVLTLVLFSGTGRGLALPGSIDQQNSISADCTAVISNTDYSQSFTTAAHSISGIEVMLMPFDTTFGTLTLTLKDDATGNTLANATKNPADSAEFTWVGFSFSSPVATVPGKVYSISVKTQADADTRWRCSYRNAYLYGYMKDAGEIVRNNDLVFRTYGNVDPYYKPPPVTDADGDGLPDPTPTPTPAVTQSPSVSPTPSASSSPTPTPVSPTPAPTESGVPGVIIIPTTLPEPKPDDYTPPTDSGGIILPDNPNIPPPGDIVVIIEPSGSSSSDSAPAGSSSPSPSSGSGGDANGSNSGANGSSQGAASPIDIKTVTLAPGSSLIIRGSSLAGAKVAIIIGERAYVTTSDKEGNWQVKIDTDTIKTGEHQVLAQTQTADGTGSKVVPILKVKKERDLRLILTLFGLITLLIVSVLIKIYFKKLEQKIRKERELVKKTLEIALPSHSRANFRKRFRS